MGMRQQWTTSSAEETKRLGASLARDAKSGDIFALTGNLASGKTTFIQGFCEALKVEVPVTSPTFTLINEYPGRLPIYHFDCYRLEGPEDLYDLGYEEYFFGNGIVLIEWADRVESLLPSWAVRLHFEHTFDNVSVREIQLATEQVREEMCRSLP